jgi:hypothetical protein
MERTRRSEHESYSARLRHDGRVRHEAVRVANEEW